MPVLALNADAQPDGCLGHPFTVSPGASVAFQLVCGVQFLAGDILCGFCCWDSSSGGSCCPGGKTESVLQCLPQSRDYQGGKKKKEKKSFMGLGLTFLSGG